MARSGSEGTVTNRKILRSKPKNLSHRRRKMRTDITSALAETGRCLAETEVGKIGGEGTETYGIGLVAEGEGKNSSGRVSGLRTPLCGPAQQGQVHTDETEAGDGGAIWPDLYSGLERPGRSGWPVPKNTPKSMEDIRLAGEVMLPQTSVNQLSVSACWVKSSFTRAAVAG